MKGPGLPRSLRDPAIAAGFLLAVQLLFSPTRQLYAVGLANGALYGLLAVGIVLIYRTQRFINFAAASLGAVPGIFGAELHHSLGVSYLPSLLTALAGGVLFGVAAHVLLFRFFASASRLILTVVSIGLGQLLALIALIEQFEIRSHQLFVPAAYVHTPFSTMVLHDSGGHPVIFGDEVVSVVFALVAVGGLALLLKRTRIGIAMRAVAENADRSRTLGIPIGRVQLIIWALAGLLGSITIFQRATIVGIPSNGSLGYTVLLFSLGAAVVARTEKLGTALAGGVAVGLIEQASVYSTGQSDVGGAIVATLILVVLLVQRDRRTRADDAATSTWTAAADPLRVPAALRRLPEVRLARGLLALAVGGLALTAPLFVGTSNMSSLAIVPITAIVAVSLVILTGWAGQISLGQYAIVGAAAVTAGKLGADRGADFVVCLLAGIAVGTLVAMAVALPAVRLQGHQLAVTTLAFAATMAGYLLQPGEAFGHLVLPAAGGPGVARPVLFGRISLASDRAYYYFALTGLVLAIAIARAYRRYRGRRVLVAVRDNARAAPSYTIPTWRTRLAGFAVSGAIASLAGVLLVFQQTAVDASTYGIEPSIQIFIAVVLGGAATLVGGISGAVVVTTVSLFVDPKLHGASLFVTGPGLIVVLLFLRGGIGQLLFALRDAFLVRVAARRGIDVPTLIALRRGAAPLPVPPAAEPQLAG